MVLEASRLKVAVSFTELPQQSNYVPFSVVVPKNVHGEFVRFVHPKNGKSAVAKIIRKEGDQYLTSINLGEVIGLDNSKNAMLYIEEVY